MTGKHSFNNQNLHTAGAQPNPYEQAITIIGRTLEELKKNLIHIDIYNNTSPPNFAKLDRAHKMVSKTPALKLTSVW